MTSTSLVSPGSSFKNGEVMGPRKVVERTKCPFCGFMGLPGALMDQSGNACALTFEHSPCSMEMADQPPCWDQCKRWNNPNNQESIKKLLETFNAFPKEFEPNRSSSWEGINAMAWFRYVTGRDF
ncbi:MAG TPA: hypothetical protein VJJ20_01850 [Candidatus Paceibacterota bacterium]